MPELEKRFRRLENKPSFIVMYDNDTAGKTNGLKLVEELREAGYPTEMFFLSEHMSGEKYPKVDANAKLIDEVSEIDAEIERMAGGAGTKLGTGGMFTKVQAAKFATSNGVNLLIMSGREVGNLRRALSGENIGTIFWRNSE